jgi:hypothetical protein
MTVSRKDVMDALADVILNALEADRNRLSAVLEDYAYTFSGSYRGMTKGGAFLAELLDTLEEAADCRIYRDASGTPDRSAAP